MANRVALITGAGSGIGREVAIALAAKGYRLALLGRTLPSLKETQSLLQQPATQEAICLVADVADSQQVNSAFSDCIDAFGRVDLVFNNAGVSAPAVAIDDVTDDDWQQVINVNVTGAFHCLRAAFKAMKTQSPCGGRIINNGSIASMSPRPRAVAYTASKHAISGLTKSASLEGRAFNIACGQIDIGNTVTSMGSATAQAALQANGHIIEEPTFSIEHVGEAVCFMDSLPPEANIPFMTLMATNMPFIGRG